MKTVLTENWILDEAKYLFSTKKFHFVAKPKLLQSFLEGHTALLHPLLPMLWLNGGCAGNHGIR